MEFLKIFECQHCKEKKRDQKLFVIMATERNRLLPINCKAGERIDPEEIFDSKKRESHLLYCPERQQDWNEIRKKYELNPSLYISFIPDQKEEKEKERPLEIKPKMKVLSAEEKADHEKRFSEILAEELKNKKELFNV